MAKGFFPGQTPATAYRAPKIYGEMGYRGQANTRGPHSSNFQYRGARSPERIGAPGGGQPPKSYKLTTRTRQG
jgi:hypothetical protein